MDPPRSCFFKQFGCRYQASLTGTSEKKARVQVGLYTVSELRLLRAKTGLSLRNIRLGAATEDSERTPNAQAL